MIEQRVHLRLLLLDDDPELRTELAEFLEEEFAYQVDAVGDSAEAVRLVTEARGAYDVALIDQMLAEGPGGIQTMQEIKALDPGLEVIIFTGRKAELRREALGAGAFHYLEKPVNFDELADLIRIAAQQVKLREIGRVALAERNPERVLAEIARAATSLASADDAAIVLLDPATGKLDVCCSSQHDEPVWRKTLKEGSLSREIIKTGEMAWIGDTLADESVNPRVVNSGIRSLRGLPIPAAEGNLGVLYVYSRTPGRFERWGTISVLQALAGQAGLAWSNLQAFQRQREQARYMEALVHTSRGLTQAKNLKKQMKLVDAFMRRQLQVSIFYVGLYKKRAGVVEVPLARDLGKSISPGPFPLKNDNGTWTASGYVLETGKELFWESQSEEERICGDLGIQTYSFGEPPAPETCIFLPLLRGGDVVGLVSIQSVRRQGFSSEQLDVFRALASQLSVALQSKRLLKKTRATAGRLKKANEVAEVVAGVTVLGELKNTLQAVVEGTKKAVGCDAVVLYVYDQVRDQLHHPPTMVGVDFPERAQELDTVERTSVVYSMLARDDLYIVERVAEDPLFHDRRFARDEGIESLVAIPLQAPEQKVGVMFVNYRSRHRFTADELTNLELFANQAAVAIHNAQLFQQQRRWADVQEALYRASRAITGSLDLQEVLGHIAEQACEVCTNAEGECALVSSVALVEDGVLSPVAAYPPQRFEKYAAVVGRIRLTPGEDQAIGVMGRAAWTKEPQLVADVTKDPDYLKIDRGTRSEVAVPMLVAGELIGVVNVEHPESDAFDSVDVTALLSVAAQAGLAIQHARRYAAEQRRVRELTGLHEISQAIRSVERMGDVYQEINEDMARFMGVEKCAILLYDEERELLVCQVPAYGLDHDFARRNAIPLGTGQPAALWKEQDTLIINDLENYPLVTELGMDQLVAESGARHTLLAKLVVSSQALGAVQVADKTDGSRFNDDDAQLLAILAAQAAAVIENARLYDDLRRTKGLVGARTALAWMGMTSSAWRHSIDKYALTIREQAELLRMDWERMSHQHRTPEVGHRIQMIRELATKILDKPITPPLSSEEGLENVSLTSLLYERTQQLWTNPPHRNSSHRFQFGLAETVTVFLSPEWLRRAFDVLVDNAVHAVQGCDVQVVTIGTRAASGGAEIFVSDTGLGIPEETRAKIGLEPIMKTDEDEGMGMGLLMAHAIVQTYGGRIRVDSTGPDGTTMVIWLPCDVGGGS